MAITDTLIAGPGVVPGYGLITVWKVLLDTSFLAAGEQMDGPASYYNEIYSGEIGGTNAIADNLYYYGIGLPDDGTAITTSTVLISAAESGAIAGAGTTAGAAKAFAAVDASDLSTVGELRVVLTGKAIT